MKTLVLLAIIIAMPLQASTIQLKFSNNWIYEFDDGTTVGTEFMPGGGGIPDYTTHFEQSSVIGWSGLNIDSNRLVDSYKSRIFGFYTDEQGFISSYTLNIKATFDPLPGGTNIPEVHARISNLGVLDVNKSLIDNLYASLNQPDFYRANGQGDNDLSLAPTLVTLVQIKTVPLPPSIWLLVTGILGLLFGSAINKKKALI